MNAASVLVLATHASPELTASKVGSLEIRPSLRRRGDPTTLPKSLTKALWDGLRAPLYHNRVTNSTLRIRAANQPGSRPSRNWVRPFKILGPEDIEDRPPSASVRSKRDTLNPFLEIGKS